MGNFEDVQQFIGHCPISWDPWVWALLDLEEYDWQIIPKVYGGFLLFVDVNTGWEEIPKVCLPILSLIPRFKDFGHFH